MDKMGATIQFRFNEQTLKAQKGQTIAEALLSQGILSVGRTIEDEPRGVFCGMGVCYECRAIVNGRPNVRICKTPVTPGCEVRTQQDAAIAGPE